MWVSKVRYRHNDCVIMPKVVKHGIVVYATPGNSYSDSKYIYNTGFLMLKGHGIEKEGFIKDLRKDKNVVKVEVNRDLIIFIEKRPKEKEEYSAFRSKEIMMVKPVYCNPADGWEYWEIFSWDKKHVTKFLNDVRKIGTAQLLGIKRMKLQDIYQFRVGPSLTNKQKEAFGLAVKEGWYNIPRKIELNQLAKFMKISRQAFSEHLRKAEVRLIPRLGEELLE